MHDGPLVAALVKLKLLQLRTCAAPFVVVEHAELKMQKGLLHW